MILGTSTLFLGALSASSDLVVNYSLVVVDSFEDAVVVPRPAKALFGKVSIISTAASLEVEASSGEIDHARASGSPRNLKSKVGIEAAGSAAGIDVGSSRATSVRQRKATVRVVKTSGTTE